MSPEQSNASGLVELWLFCPGNGGRRMALPGRACLEAIYGVRRAASIGVCVRTEQSVWVQCLRCGHSGVLTAETLSRLAMAPSAPIASFIKRLRCRRCGSQSVGATRKPVRPQRGFAKATKSTFCAVHHFSFIDLEG